MITIRNGLPEDADFIAAHAHRLLEFGPPHWRKQEQNQMTLADTRHITAALLADDPDTSVLVAVDPSGKPLSPRMCPSACVRVCSKIKERTGAFLHAPELSGNKKITTPQR